MTKPTKQLKREQRRKRVRARVVNVVGRPRFCVFRSNNHLLLQIIDDQKHIVLAASSDRELAKGAKKRQSCTVSIAEQLGALLAERAKKAGVNKVVFDRAGYKFHGQVKAAAESARKAGLSF